MRSQNGGGVEKLGPLTPEITDSKTLYENLLPLVVQGHGSSKIESFFVVPENVFIYFSAYSGLEIGYNDSAPWFWKENQNTYFDYLYRLLYEPGFSDTKYIRNGSVILQPGDVVPDMSLSFSPTEIYYPPLGMFPVPIRDDERKDFGLLNDKEFFYLPTLLKIVSEGYLTKKKIMSLGVKEEHKEELSRILDLTVDVSTFPLNKLNADYWFVHSSPPPYYESMKTYRIMKTKKNMLKGTTGIHLSNLISSTKLSIKSKYFFFIVTACRGSVSKAFNEMKSWQPAYLPPSATPKLKLQRRLSLALRPAYLDVGCAFPDEPPLNLAYLLHYFLKNIKDSDARKKISKYLNEASEEEKSSDKYIIYRNYNRLSNVLENILNNNLVIKFNEFLTLLNFSSLEFDQSSLIETERIPFAEELFGIVKIIFSRFLTGVMINLGANSQKSSTQLIYEALEKPFESANTESMKETVKQEQKFIEHRRPYYEHEISEHKKQIINAYIENLLSSSPIHTLRNAIVQRMNEIREEFVSDIAELESSGTNISRGFSQLEKTYDSMTQIKQDLINIFSRFFAKYRAKQSIYISEEGIEIIMNTVFNALFKELLELDEEIKQALDNYSKTLKEGGFYRRKIGTRRRRNRRTETQRKCRTGSTVLRRLKARTRV